MKRFTVSCLVFMCVTSGAYGIDMEEIGTVPPSPTPSDVITLHVLGTFDHSLAQSIQRAPWQRVDNEMLIDLLVFELPLEAPSIPGPFEQEVVLGQLPTGEYDVTARTFRAVGPSADPSPFPDPWLFPDEFNGTAAVATLQYRFTVVPEPASAVLLGLLISLICVSRLRYS